MLPVLFTGTGFGITGLPRHTPAASSLSSHPSNLAQIPEKETS
jgi:hypothetical protein